MLKDALIYLEGRFSRARDVQQIEIDGQKFTDRELVRVPEEPVFKPEGVAHSTLRSLVAYVTDDADEMVPRTFLSVVSPTEVRAISPTLGAEEQRKHYAVAKALTPGQKFGAYMPLEDMGIYLRTCFVQTEARDELVRTLGAVVDGAEAEIKDDGVTQSTVLRRGISMKKDGEIPGVVDLQPYRTFYDVEQPASPFVVRLKKGREGVEAALFTADGGVWQHEATARVAAFLREALPGVQVYA